MQLLEVAFYKEIFAEYKTKWVYILEVHLGRL